VTANVGGTLSSVAIYTGSGLTDLSLVACQNYGGTRTFHAQAGTTYHIQVVLLDQFGGEVSIRLFPAPDPVASMTFQPMDPSTFDSIQFFDLSFDPGGEGLQPGEWTFGDGSTATGCCPVHRYAADGDYSVNLATTTTDGRSAHVTQTVRVRTHDVAITKLVVPQSASAGQTRQITVGLSNRRYPESVSVELYRSSPNGFQLVGTLTQSVAVRAGNRTTDFSFSYTFTAADASIGKVPFRAIAILHGARDALLADNELIASPTKIAK
jgi:PKD repeat protein